MNIHRPQIPYVFHPPKYSPCWAPLLKWLASERFLKRKFKVRSVTIKGMEPLKACVQAGHPVLVTPNHADHADPSLLVHAAREHGLSFQFMAAREGFEKDWFGRFALQRLGAFSVDREGADIAAIKTAMEVLGAGQFPLVIFPEGEIYHHHEKLDALNEGVATILLRTAKRLEEGKPAYLVPTAIRFAHKPGVASTFAERLDRLEASIAWKPMPYIEPVERIYRLGGGLLALKEVEWLGATQSGELVDRIRGLQESLVEMIENKHGASAHSGERIPVRVKTMRNKIRKILTDQERGLGTKESWDLYHDLEALFVAVQLYSYPGQYLKEDPTPSRIAETLLKLEEDVLGEGQYLGEREAFLTFDEPLEVRAFLKDKGLDHKTGVAPLTEYIAERVQALLDER